MNKNLSPSIPSTYNINDGGGIHNQTLGEQKSLGYDNPFSNSRINAIF